jgi:aspartate/methionine/tyrosine aminotransferase
MSDMLARVALAPERRKWLLERTRRILNENYPVIRDWVASHGNLFSLVPPQSGAIAYLKYDLPVNSLELVERLREEKSVLIVAGEHFLMGNYLRIGYGSSMEYLRSGLQLTSDFISEWNSDSPL